jgi:hypothetical protein
MDLDDRESQEIQELFATQEAISRLGASIEAETSSCGSAAADSKEVQTALSKFNKLVDKSMPPDLGKAVKQMNMDSALLHEVIMDHLIRTGNIDVARTLAKESDQEVEEERVQPFLLMMEVREAVKRRDLGPARMWATEHRQQLQEIGSDVCFRIVRMEFVQLVSRGDVLGAVELARNRYAAKHFLGTETSREREHQSRARTHNWAAKVQTCITVSSL